MTPAHATAEAGEEVLYRSDGAHEGRVRDGAIVLVLDEEVIPVVGVHRKVTVVIKVLHEFESALSVVRKRLRLDAGFSVRVQP